jgi:hypothetical protein
MTEVVTAVRADVATIAEGVDAWFAAACGRARIHDGESRPLLARLLDNE